MDDGESSVCDISEGSVALLAFRTLLKELLAIELPSPKVRASGCSYGKAGGLPW